MWKEREERLDYSSDTLDLASFGLLLLRLFNFANEVNFLI